MKPVLPLAILALVVVASCGGEPAPLRTPEQRGADSRPAVTALQAGRFDDAARHATTALALDPNNAQAAAVRAIAAYQVAGQTLVHEMGQIIEQAEGLDALDHKAGRAAWQTFVDRLDAIDRDLAVVAAEPSFALELCIACWDHDWNHSGGIDDRDRKMFELEYDGVGGELPDGDARRRPTFRFDVGDADWARAMLAFQRAGVELILAYKWSELDKLFRGRDPERLVIHLDDAKRVQRARDRILAGVGFADRCREAYLAETDDDREWVPNPRQVNHPVPLAVDDQLYATWAAVTRDVRHLLRGDEGIAMREVAALVDDDLVAFAPDAYIDVGRLLREPSDIVFDVRGADESRASAERILKAVLGKGYATGMKPSPLVGRLHAMKGQLDRGEETLEHKLRYLFWLN